MARAYSMDLRECVIRDAEAGVPTRNSRRGAGASWTGKMIASRPRSRRARCDAAGRRTCRSTTPATLVAGALRLFTSTECGNYVARC